MTLLPVVERELRVGARDRATYRLRFAAALLTTAFSVFSIWFVTLMGDRPIPPRDLFLILTWIEFIFVAVAGFALTCDSISGEKRDATLGLLFLTDLRGYDVVLGKLCVAGLRGTFALIATIPVLALPLMLGGTNLAEFGRTSLSLLITLFFSMAVGLLVSSLVRKNWAAFGISASVLGFFLIFLPIFGLTLQNIFARPDLGLGLRLPSASFAMMISFRDVSAFQANFHLISLGIIVLLALITLVITTLVTPHVWKDRPPKKRWARFLEFVYELKYGARKTRDAFRRRILTWNPVFWLSRRERVSSFGMLMIIAALGVTAGFIAGHDWQPVAWQAGVVIPFIAWVMCGVIIHALIQLRLAVLAAERFGDDRRSGALELILATPMQVKEVLAGHWWGLLRYMIGPIVIVFGIQILVVALFLNVQYLDENNVYKFSELLINVWRHVFTDAMVPSQWEYHFGILVMLLLFPILVMQWIALAWMSTWLSLRVQAALLAPIASVLALYGPPWILLGIVMIILDDLRLLPNHDFSEALVGVGLGTLFVTSYQILCIWWSRRNLYRHFRTAATDRYQPHVPFSWWRYMAGRFLRKRSAGKIQRNAAPTELINEGRM